MTDYTELRKELYEKFHESYDKLYVSELKDENEKLKARIKVLEERLADASWTAEMYRDQIDDRPKW